MIVVGVDPGSVRLGWGVIAREGTRLRGIDAGVIKLPERAPIEERLEQLYEELVAVLRKHGAQEVAVEEVFFARFPKAALQLGHARGVALLCARHAGATIASYPPAVVKQTIAGRGAADKAQVARMVGAILGWRDLPSVDATDALAVAITHCNAVRLSPRPGLAPRTPTRRTC